MADSSDDPDHQQVIFAMFLGAVVGAVFGYVFYQDIWQGIIVGIGVGTSLVMVFPARIEEVHTKLGAEFGVDARRVLGLTVHSTVRSGG